jgi:uncharacterized protein (TIGR03437 family)
LPPLGPGAIIAPMRKLFLFGLCLSCAAVDFPRTTIAPNPKSHLPLVFEPNRGQSDPRVQFLARGPGYRLFLSSREAVFDSPGGNMRLQFVAANPAAGAAGLLPSGGTSNYFHGADPSLWRTAIPHYSQVRLTALYPGVDLLYYSHKGELEFDFIVHPGADPAAIRMRWLGAQSLSLSSEGHLLAHSSFGRIRQHRPLVFQLSGDRRVQVAASYRIDSAGGIALQLGPYDPRRPLIIDPVITFATFSGGGQTDEYLGVAVDPAGNIYAAGYTESANFPATPGAHSSSAAGNRDAVVSKLNPAGTAILYSTFIGGSQNDRADEISVDAAGNAYVVGDTSSTNFPITAGAFDRSLGGSQDAFALKLNPAGAALSYATYVGGRAFENGLGLAVDPAGNLWIAGRTHSPDFPTTPDSFDPSFNNPGEDQGDGYILKINASGSGVLYGAFAGGNLRDVAQSLALDPAGNLYVGGYTHSPNFPTTPGAFDTSLDNPASGTRDIFILKVAPGGALLYSTLIGGEAEERAEGIAVDPTGNVYITGMTSSQRFPVTAGAFDTSHNGGDDAFLAKLNPQGSALVFSTFLGGSGSDWALAIAVDAAGSAHISGYSSSGNFPFTPGAFQSSLSGAQSPFLVKSNAAGSALVFSSFLGGSGFGNFLALDRQGDVVIAGSAPAGFRPTPGVVQIAFAGGSSDAFVLKADVLAGLPAAISASSGSNQSGPPNARLPVSLTVRVADARGAPVPGQSVSFTATNASVSPPSAVTGTLGTASTDVTLGPLAGPASVSAAAPPASATFPFTVGQASPRPAISAIVNGASFLPSLQDGAWASILGSNLSATSRLWNAATEIVDGALPTSLDGVTVTVDGKPAAIFFISDRQVNFQVPVTARTGPVEVVLTNSLGSAAASATVAAYSPALFLFDPQGRKFHAALIALPSGAVDYLGPASLFGSALSTRPAKPGEILLLFGTGFGPTSPPVPAGRVFAGAAPLDPPGAVSATIGGLPARVLFAGITGAGLYQFNLEVPAVSAGEHRLLLRIAGLQSQDNVFIAVDNP